MFLLIELLLSLLTIGILYLVPQEVILATIVRYIDTHNISIYSNSRDIVARYRYLFNNIDFGTINLPTIDMSLL